MGVKGDRRKPKKKKIKFTHKDLCYDLAEAKGTRYIEVPLGSKYLNYGNVSQADVITIKPSYNKFNLDIYECKVTRSDFLQDVKKGKYKNYLEHCNRLYFAVTSGLVKPEEIPDGVGLIVRGENGWTTVKSAKKREIDFSKEMLLSMVFFNGRSYNKRRDELGNYLHSLYNITRKDRLQGFNRDIKNMILNYNNLEMKFRNLLHHASRRIPFLSDKEKEEWEIEWENKTYTRKY